jgi:Tol biopolymer transport system component/predicted Ser/Thr protein kinase
LSISAGSRLGPYEIVAPIGAGGMGEVWRARDTRLDRLVAIKVLPAEVAHNEEFKLRFEREAKAISQLNHPNICQLYDVGDDYLVMELIDGESLADRIARGPLPLDQVLRYGIEIADALDKAHRSGIVHRDLKPGNVMVTKSGAKLLDFGLASVRPAINVSSPQDATMQRALTQEGTILGTFQYMAPEQLEGLPADARTDIFALGCVLYEMLTGRRAFEAKNRTSLIAAIVSGTPRSITESQPLTPPALEHIVQRCLAKDPDERWQSAHDVAEDLRWIRTAGSQAGVAAPLIQRHRNRQRLFAALAIIAVVAAIGTALYIAAHRPKPVNLHFTLPGMTDEYAAASFARISPDGATALINATRRSDRQAQLYLRRLDEFEAKAVEGSNGARHSAWSPDGRSLAFVARNKVQRLDLNGGTPHVLATGGQAAGIAWHGDWIYWGENEGPLRRVPASGGDVEVLTKTDPARHELGHEFPFFLPDGRHLLFITYTRDPSSSERAHTLYAATIDGKSVQRIGPVSSRVYYYGGHLFFVRDGTLYAQPFDVKALKFAGEPKPVMENLQYFQPTGGTSVAVSDDGMITAAPLARPNRIVITDLAGHELSTVVDDEETAERISISPDGSQIYFARLNPNSGTPDIWAYGVTRPTKTQLTFDPDEEGVPVLSGDGKRLYYESDRNGVPDIFEKTLDGSAPDRAVVVAEDYQEPTSVSPDGKFLLYTSSEGKAETGDDVWVASLAGDAKPRRIASTPKRDHSGIFSPDGKWVAYISNASGTLEVYVVPFPGPGQPVQVTTSLRVRAAPRWAPDGKSIFFATDNAVYQCAIGPQGQPGDPKLMFSTADRILSLEVMPDGKRFALNLWSEVRASPPIRVISHWTP